MLSLPPFVKEATSKSVLLYNSRGSANPCYSEKDSKEYRAEVNIITISGVAISLQRRNNNCM